MNGDNGDNQTVRKSKLISRFNLAHLFGHKKSGLGSPELKCAICDKDSQGLKYPHADNCGTR